MGMLTAHTLEQKSRMDFLLRRRAETERKRSDDLLLNILPEKIAERLKDGEDVIAAGP